MDRFASSNTFDIKTILCLREDVKSKLSEQEKRPVTKLGSAELELLSEKIIEVTREIGIKSISERRLRNFLSDKVTDELKLPSIKAGNSIVDAICIYLGYSGLDEYQSENFSQIHRVKYQIERTYSLADPLLPEIKRRSSKIEYFTSYYLSYFGIVHAGVTILDHKTNQCNNYYSELKMPGGSDIFSEEILYTGPFEITKDGYLTFYGTLQGFGQHITMYSRAYYDDDRKNFKYIVGTYMGTSNLEYNNIAGAAVLERASSLEEAKARWDRPVDGRIEAYLKGKRVETKRRGFYSLDELITNMDS